MTAYVVAILAIIGVIYLAIAKQCAAGKTPSYKALEECFVVFDLETTGLKAEQHEIIEIGAIRFTKGTDTHDTFQALIRPKKSLPKKITELTGITQSMLVNDGEELQSVIVQFKEFVGDLRLVAFNAEFDMAFLQAATAKCSKPPFMNPVSCALKMARRAWPNRNSYKLVDLARDGQIQGGTAHRALEDARRALIIYTAAAAILKSKN